MRVTTATRSKTHEGRVEPDQRPVASRSDRAPPETENVDFAGPLRPGMDGSDFREAVETARETELSRLGSSQLLVALTGAELEPAAVLAVAADSEAAAEGTFRAWADDEGDERAREAFAAVAEQETAHLASVREALADVTPDATGRDADGTDDPGPMHGYLRGREGTIERVAGGMVGRPLVSLRTHTQIINFFVNEPDERRANLFRDLRGDTEETLADGLALLEDLCGDEDDWERAQATAEYTVELAYDSYADALREVGLDPKMVC